MKASMLKLSILLLFYDCVTALIIPEELPTILSLIYSNIPPIRKGTDSRLGVGFRLGEHADFQVLVELGPQVETKPIGENAAERRRMVTYGAAMRGDLGPWAQSVAKYQTQMRLQNEVAKMKQLEDKLARIKLENGEKIERKKTSNSDWLTNWSEGVVPTDEGDSAKKKLSTEKITLTVKNDKRFANRRNGEVFVEESEKIQERIRNLKKLLKQQPIS